MTKSAWAFQTPRMITHSALNTKRGVGPIRIAILRKSNRQVAENILSGARAVKKNLGNTSSKGTAQTAGMGFSRSESSLFVFPRQWIAKSDGIAEYVSNALLFCKATFRVIATDVADLLGEQLRTSDNFATHVGPACFNFVVRILQSKAVAHNQ